MKLTAPFRMAPAIGLAVQRRTFAFVMPIRAHKLSGAKTIWGDFRNGAIVIIIDVDVD